MTIGLLPPNPDVPAAYWLARGAETPVIGLWCPADLQWNLAGWYAPASVSDMAQWGYTFAKLPARPIPGPAALEAVYEVVETLLDVADLAVITPQDGIHVGPVIYAASGAEVKALRDAAAMLRATLETKETT